VVVLSNNDGCAVALSNEAKALGLKRGDPYFKIRYLCDSNDVAVLSGDHHYYGHLSKKVMDILRELAGDSLEIYSIDEAFMHIDPALGDMGEYGQYVVETVMEQTGIPVSLGIARTKTIAKIAARFAKKYPGYHGACVIDTSEKLAKALSLTPVEDVWGIGRRLSRKLHDRGISTAKELADIPKDAVKSLFNVAGTRTWRELHEEPCIQHDITPPEHQTISSSRSFARDVHSIEDLRQAITTFCSIIGRKLRRKNLVASEITVYIRTNRFHEHQQQYANSASIRLPHHTDYTPHLVAAAIDCLMKVYRPDVGFKKAGVTVSHIQSRHGLQGDIFSDHVLEAKRARLMKVVDSINSSNKSPAANIHLAAMGSGLTTLTRREHAPDTNPTSATDNTPPHPF